MIHRDSTGKSTASLPKEYRTDIDYDKFDLVNDNAVLFVWLDENEEEFVHKSGIVIKRTLAKDKERWGVIVKVHPTVTDVQVGEYIVVDKTHEPFSCVINGLAHWQVWLKDIRMVSADKSVTESLKGDVEAINVRSENTVDA